MKSKKKIIFRKKRKKVLTKPDKYCIANEVNGVVAELVDAPDSKSGFFGSESSILSGPTIKIEAIVRLPFLVSAKRKNSNMIWLGYFFTAVNYECYCLSRFMRHKKMMLLLDLLAKVFTSIGLYCLNSLSGAYVFIAVFFMLIVANIKERLNKRWLLGYIFFQSVYLIILYFTYVGISSILAITTVSVTLFCIWWLPPQQMRVVGGLNSFTFLAYQISIKNWAGLLEILVIVSNFLAFMKYKKAGVVK